MGVNVVAQPRTPPRRRVDEYDPADLAELLLDIQRGLRFIRDGQGYGRITVEMEIRKGQISRWETAPALSRKPKRVTGGM